MASFQFGQINASRKRSNTNEIKEFFLKDHILADNYYLILTDYVLSQGQILMLDKDISKRIDNYCIVSSITSNNLDKDSTENLMEVESNWRSYLKFNEFKAKSILTLGSAIRLIAKSGDVMWTDFLDTKFNNPFIIGNQKYQKVTDSIKIYGCAGINHLYPTKTVKSGSSDLVNWTTRHFYEQLTNMKDDTVSKFKYDFRESEVISIMDDYKSVEPGTRKVSNIVKTLRMLQNSELLTFDIETDGLHFIDNNIYTLQLSNDGKTAYYFKWDQLKNHIDELKKTLESAQYLAGSNPKFDTRFLWQQGCKISLRNLWATDLMAHALNSNLLKGLKPLSIRYTNIGSYDISLDTVKKRLKVENYTQIPDDTLKEYSGLDVIATWRVFKALEENIHYCDIVFPNIKQKDWTIWRYIEEIMNPNYKIVLQTEFRGVYMGKDTIESGREKLTIEADRLLTEIIKEINAEIDTLPEKIKKVDKSFEWGSTKELGILLENLKWPCIERGSDGTYSTADACLETWRLNHSKKAAPLISDWRSIMVGIKTFMGTGTDDSEDDTGWPKYIRYHEEDDSWRAHPNCLVQAAESFRHKMRSPNFQQIPTKSLIGKICKQAIVVPNSYDYKITDENGKTWTNENHWNLKTQRGLVDFCDLKETDEILDYGVTR